MFQIRNFPNFKIYGNVAEQIWNCGFKNMEILNGTFQKKVSNTLWRKIKGNTNKYMKHKQGITMKN